MERLKVPEPPKKEHSRLFMAYEFAFMFIIFISGIMLGALLVNANIKAENKEYVKFTNNNTENKTLIDFGGKIPLNYAYMNYHGDEIEYDYDNYNCVNFTENFIKYMDSIGIFCQVIRGCPENKTADCHRWASCDIEPQSFTFVDYRGKYPKQWRDYENK